ncbi:DNA/RNA non-specific endonuclease [Altererythrobacter sp. GH1-8]|uniref:DNA/RNA non-specific endonuclease n=1 Tax=Altererythrobacter sp. GH1-8 TaxID=3349333 RepID=UPI00374C90B1
MIDDPFQMQRELRYGAPRCDQILTGRHFTIGYSWYFRQAKWTLEIINRDRELVNDLAGIERLDNFRADTRIPKRFRAGLKAYVGSGYDRGHLCASANQDLQNIQNSETFLLSNMSPMKPQFNRGIWSKLEHEIRVLDARESTLETYVLTCPVFYFGEKVERIGKEQEDFGISVPVPHAFIKSVLVENKRGRFRLWTFEIPNKKQTAPLGDFLVKTYDAEQIVGGRFWDRISGSDLHTYKSKPGKMW